MEHAEEKLERLEGLLQNKTFADLDEDERHFVIEETGSEEQYNVLRKVSLALVENRSDLSPDPTIFASLKDEMKKKKDGTKSFWLTRPLTITMPSYAAAIVIICAVAIGLYVGSTDRDTLAVNPAPQSIRYDTIVVSVRDTIYRDRVVYKYMERENTSGAITVAKTNQRIEPFANEGVNMKEKEELESFLVSGS